mgnify:CR=1 FL=1
MHTGRLVPVYPSTNRLPQRTLRKLIKQTLDIALPQVTDFLSTDLKYRLQLVDLRNSITQIHFPDSTSGWELAKRRLSFDELFLIQLAVLKRKYKWKEQGKGISLVQTKSFLSTFTDSIPFTLTTAQVTALDEILSDLQSDNNITIKAPLVGTYYKSPKPDTPPFISEGDEIKEGQIICIIEAMKIFNEIESDYSGKVINIKVEDNNPVEFDQVVMIIAKD